MLENTEAVSELAAMAAAVAKAVAVSLLFFNAC